MKKILLMMVPIPVTDNYNNAYTEKSKPPKKVIKKAERFDFRKVRWGINKSQIRLFVAYNSKKLREADQIKEVEKSLF